jgi:hypothetical protein
LNIFRMFLAFSLTTVLIGCTVNARNSSPQPPSDIRYVYDTSSRAALSASYDTLREFKLKSIEPLGDKTLGYKARMDGLPLSIHILPCVGFDGSGRKIVAYAVEYRLNGVVVSPRPIRSALQKIHKLSKIRDSIERRLENHKIVMYKFHYIDL